MDKFIVGSLELRAEERQLAVGRRSDAKQMASTYHLNIVRYRYEVAQPAPFLAVNSLKNV